MRFADSRPWSILNSLLRCLRAGEICAGQRARFKSASGEGLDG